MTKETGRLFLMAGDQKVEHLNDDFVGKSVASDDSSPNHLFEIAAKAPIGCFAAQLGLIARYAMDYRDVPYLIKLNSKTHLVKKDQKDPVSLQWQETSQVEQFVRHSGVRVVALGYTLYPGSEYEPAMLAEASRLIFEAHQMGLVFVLWVYPRGRSVANENDAHLIAGGAGVGACLGADFIKINPPVSQGGAMDGSLLKEAVLAAGRSQVVCAGGAETTVPDFLKRLYDQIHLGGTSGCATGRNVHQRSFEEAVRLCRAIHSIAVLDQSVEKALDLYNAG
jgi:class I fructose-bisphosphate aldolase